MKKILYFFLLLILLLSLTFDFFYKRLPIITGFSAKQVSSWTELTNRTQIDIEENELSFFPLNLSSNKIDKSDNSVLSTVWGMAEQKAVYREGLGSALIADYNEDYVRKQRMKCEILPFNPDTITWPYGDKLPENKLSVVDVDKLEDAIDKAFESGNTRSVIVCYDTVFLKEKYKKGFSKDTRMLGWSMSKSVINALIGIMVRQGKLNIYDGAPVKEWQNDERKNITISSLLHMTGGLEWKEDYGNISDVTVMLYKKGDMGGFAINKPAVFPPDSVWYYSSGTSNILSLIIRRAFNSDKDYWQFPRKELFNKTGMRSMVFETDASGTFVGSSYTFATARDWARFGLLYLNDGMFNGKRILPEGWSKYTSQPAPNSDGKYGAHFWRQPKELPDAPKDTYFCDGYHGQRVYIIPSKKIVIVRFGLNKKGDFNFNTFVKSILDAFDN
jgi:CubicO group peptidase (beta-lactamase class C family)